MKAHELLTVALALALVVGTLPAATVATSAPEGGAEAVATDAALAVGATQTGENATGNGTVNVTVGSQLSTVLQVTDAEVGSELEESAFEFEYESASGEDGRAEAVAERAEALQEGARAVREDYREATAAYEAGELSESEYAQRLATLNARAVTVLAAAERLRVRAANVSALELRAQGYSAAEVNATVASLDNVTGVGATALLRQFTGESRGELEIRTADGLRIESTSEDGEQSREIERARDDNTSFTVAQSAALETARTALSTPVEGNWTLVASKVKEYDGAYEFEFALRGSANRTGEAEVRVDGSSGVVYRLEEETEPRDDDEREREDEGDDDSTDDSEGELALVVTDGTPGPNETVTLTVLANGTPAEGATVALNGDPVGTTDGDGRVRVTLPERGEADLKARSGDREGELEFEFGDDDSDEEESFERALDATASVADGTVTVRVTYDGSGVAGATVTADGDPVGTTDADGRLTFETSASEELEIAVTKGEFEAEFTFAADGEGGLALVETDLKDGGAAPSEDDSSEDEQESGDDDSEDDSDSDDSDDDSDSDDSEDDSDDDSDESGDDSDEGETDGETEDDSTDTPEDDSDDDSTDTPEDDSDDDSDDTPEDDSTDTPEDGR